jgi:hypothetical protein
VKIYSWFALLAAVALVAAAAGCGGGGSTTSSSTEASNPPATTTTSEAPSPAPEPSGEKGKQTKPKAEGEKPESGSASEGPESAKLKKQLTKEEEEPGDHSIQEYGSEASGGQKEAVLSAMNNFIDALATKDYDSVCTGLVKANREQLSKYMQAASGSSGGGCAAVLKKLLVPAAAAEARKNLHPAIGRVRIGEGSAFVVFRPAGGKLSYFVLKEEDGEWKSVSLAPGTPFAP